jgi:hypothetical protein
MTHGAMVAIHAATVAAAAAKARTDVLDAFRVRDATAADRARALADVGLSIDNKAVQEFISAGVIRGVDSRGRLTVLGDSIDRVVGYYLDEPAYITHRDAESKSSKYQALIIVCSMVFLALVAILVAVVLRNR